MRERLSSEDGFTLIELLVGMIILVVGIFGLVASFDRSRKLVTVSENQAGAAALAERQLDAGLAVPFNKLALNTNPATASSPTSDDTKWVNVLTYGTELAGSTVTPIVPTGTNNCGALLTQLLSNPTVNVYNELVSNDERQCLVVCPGVSGVACPTTDTTPAGTGLIMPYQVFTDARGNRYKVFRYVTWANDVPCGVACPNPGLPTATAGASVNPWFGDYKRLTIAVQVISRTTGNANTQNTPGPRVPVVVSGIKIDPTRGVGNTPGNVSPFSLPGVIG